MENSRIINNITKHEIDRLESLKDEVEDGMITAVSIAKELRNRKRMLEEVQALTNQ